MFVYLEKHQGGKYYDCNDNGRKSCWKLQECIDEVLGNPNPFGNGKKVISAATGVPVVAVNAELIQGMFRLLEEYQGGKYYDCNDNGRARAAGNSQACIDEDEQAQPFRQWQKRIVRRNWGPCVAACNWEYGIFLEGGEKVASDNKDDEDTRKK